jgi:hypothetical protein
LPAEFEFDEDQLLTWSEGSPADGKFVALYRIDGAPTAVLGWNAPARMHRYRKLLRPPEGNLPNLTGRKKSQPFTSEDQQLEIRSVSVVIAAERPWIYLNHYFRVGTDSFSCVPMHINEAVCVRSRSLMKRCVE